MRKNSHTDEFKVDYQHWALMCVILTGHMRVLPFRRCACFYDDLVGDVLNTRILGRWITPCEHVRQLGRAFSS